MKFLTSLIIGSLSFTILNAQTTMCFKENHKSMTTIESTKLDGGLCKSLSTSKDMEKNGWTVDDIKINKSDSGFNYIYIFKKQSVNTNSTYIANEQDFEEKIMARIKKEEKIKIAVAKKKKAQANAKSGKIKYTKTCQSCHGGNGENEYGTSRAINTLNLEDFQTIMRDYGNMSYDRGQAEVMFPYTSTVTGEDISNIYEYLKKINK